MKLNNCLSVRCPSWIVTDTANKRVKVDGRKTHNQHAQGMFIYLYQYDDAITKEYVAQQMVIFSVTYV